MAATVQPQTIAPGVKDSLVKYDTPVLVTGNKPKPKAALPKFDRHSVATSEDVLAAIVAPRQWKVDGQVWEQSLSSTPATRIDVINLQVSYDARVAANEG
jgi:dynein light intermediate chain